MARCLCLCLPSDIVCILRVDPNNVFSFCASADMKVFVFGFSVSSAHSSANIVEAFDVGFSWKGVSSVANASLGAA